jgi:hypothetical protein
VEKPRELLQGDIDVLRLLLDSFKGGGFAVALSGTNAKSGHKLETFEYARWVGTNWGCNFWQITDEGRKYLGESE